MMNKYLFLSNTDALITQWQGMEQDESRFQETKERANFYHVRYNNIII